jgi:mannose-6-phosphate isomerase-like protein (cupin superfamily)
MSGRLPDVITLAFESSGDCSYENHVIAANNEHVVRISTMTEAYPWHFHPNSDETFLGVEGRLAIEFEGGTRQLGPGQLLTVPRGVRHRTWPMDGRSVNLTFELAACETVVL